jgi:hypothetical protein
MWPLKSCMPIGAFFAISSRFFRSFKKLLRICER